MKFPVKRLIKNAKRRKTLIGIAIAAAVIALIVGVAVFMDASSVTLINTNAKAGSIIGGGRISSGSNATMRAVAFDGYVFTEWTNKDGSVASREPSYKMQIPASDITLYANWKLIDWSLELNLNSNDNTTEYPKTFTVESETIFLNPPTRTGYTFLGWYLDENFLKPYKYDYIPQGTAEEITLYAKWAPSYKITYDLDVRVSNDPDNPTTYTEFNSVLLESPVWYELNDRGQSTGGSYKFLGWYDEGNNRVTEIPKEWKRDVTLHARWDMTDPVYYNIYTKGNYIYVDLGHYPNHILEDPATLYFLKEAIRTGAIEPDPETHLFSYQNTLYAQATASPYQSGTYFSDDTYVKKGESFFFIVEPIRWRVLSGDPNDPNSVVTLLSEDILTASPFQTSLQVRSYAGVPVYANNWEKSMLREFLNGTFYAEAFKEGEAKFIQTTQVDIGRGVSHFDTFANGKKCDDKVYLLSYKDLANSKYHWDHWTKTEDSRKVAKATDYAKAMGVYSSLNGGKERDACHWWLRTPGDFEDTASLTTALGTVGTYNVKTSCIGVRPAITVKLG
ncbi:MAG: DUF6273 domain-containing protein [Clostridia bacterium]|nr:DUF6273 domain-containing protein [Clostridia bacterium]